MPPLRTRVERFGFSDGSWVADCPMKSAALTIRCILAEFLAICRGKSGALIASASAAVEAENAFDPSSSHRASIGHMMSMSGRSEEPRGQGHLPVGSHRSNHKAVIVVVLEHATHNSQCRGSTWRHDMRVMSAVKWPPPCTNVREDIVSPRAGQQRVSIFGRARPVSDAFERDAAGAAGTSSSRGSSAKIQTGGAMEPRNSFQGVCRQFR